MQPGSPIDAFYAARGTIEPFEGNMQRHGISSAKLLVRKVAAMAYAQALARIEGTRIVLWADADVEFIKLPDDRFLQFVGGRDVTYTPFEPGQAHPRIERGLLGVSWRVESGLMAFSASDNAIGLVSSALDLYEGECDH